jgi:hypothetical protein
MRTRSTTLLVLLSVILMTLLPNTSRSLAAPWSIVDDFSILLGRPTDHSVTANVIPTLSGELSFEYGTAPGVYGSPTAAFPCTANEPAEAVIDGLSANTQYYYRLRGRATSGEPWTTGEEHSFRTQRAPGSSFTFTLVSDSHLGQYGGQTTDEKALYTQTLQNILGDQPDFHIDLGDTFAMDPTPLGTGMTEAEARAAYLVQRPFLDEISASTPVYLVLGNHENEEGWNWDDTFTAPDGSLAVRGIKQRKLYYPNPIPDDFYTGNTDVSRTAIEGDHLQEDYYAWEWGDALFVVLDPYHYSMKWPSEGNSYGGEGQDGEAGGDRWDWSLGIQQYLWLKDTLEDSDATYKFVFAHHVTGGSTVYGRGGIGAAPYFEWGGRNADGTWGWDTERPASEGWDVPIHQLMVETGVDVFFHGHDHIYAMEELDGIVYLEAPKPDDAGYAWQPYGYGYNEGLYPDGDMLQNSGHIRVRVSPTETTINYVRAYLPEDGTNGTVARTLTIPATTATPTITITGTPLSAFGSVAGTPSAAQSYTVAGSNLTGDITITPPADFQVSLSSGSGWTSSSLTLPRSGGSVAATPIYVRFSRATAGSSGGNITHTSGGATAQNVVVSGTATTSDPTDYLGDVDSSDSATSTDALIILSANVGMNTSQFCPMNCGDVNADGYVDSTDALIILSHNVGMTVPFPVGQPGCPASVTQPPGCTP